MKRKPDKPMEPGTFDPEERARQKAASRAKDDADLASGKISSEELQRVNGLGRVFKSIKVSHRPRFRGSVKLHWPEDN